MLFVKRRGKSSVVLPAARYCDISLTKVTVRNYTQTIVFNKTATAAAAARLGCSQWLVLLLLENLLTRMLWHRFIPSFATLCRLLMLIVRRYQLSFLRTLHFDLLNMVRGFEVATDFLLSQGLLPLLCSCSSRDVRLLRVFQSSQWHCMTVLCLASAGLPQKPEWQTAKSYQREC